jgi:hypothetical protein
MRQHPGIGEPGRFGVGVRVLVYESPKWPQKYSLVQYDTSQAGGCIYSTPCKTQHNGWWILKKKLVVWSDGAGPSSVIPRQKMLPTESRLMDSSPRSVLSYIRVKLDVSFTQIGEKM